MDPMVTTNQKPTVVTQKERNTSILLKKIFANDMIYKELIYK